MPESSDLPGQTAVFTLRSSSAGIPSLTMDGIEVTAWIHRDDVDISVRMRIRGRLRTYKARVARASLPLSARAMTRLFPVAADAALMKHRSTLMIMLGAFLVVESPEGPVVLQEPCDPDLVLSGATMIGEMRIVPEDLTGPAIPSSDERRWMCLSEDRIIAEPDLEFYPSVIHLRNRLKAVRTNWHALISPFDEFLGALAIYQDASKPDCNPPNYCAVFLPSRVSFQPNREVFSDLLDLYDQVLIGKQSEGRLLLEYHLEIEPDESRI